LKQYPALEVGAEATELLLAMVDDFSPTAIEETETRVRVFFSTERDRDAARAVVAHRFPVTAIDVSDDDWARRSQDNLQPVTVGRLTISPNPESLIPNPDVIVIVPSMGFGTGHHATTRLCLEALQTIDLTGAVVVDVGTGSGVLAIAADRLGAAMAFGIDTDRDAIQSACENLAHNWGARHVTFAIGDLSASPLPAADVITANLTGAQLLRSAERLLQAVRPGGTLILSGLQAHERDAVVRAFAPATIVRERTEDEWVGLTMKKS
jgi:ribosomal protein L11 methyltransferase